MDCGHLAICSRFRVISFSHFSFDLGPWPLYPSFPLPQNVDCRKGSTRGPLQDVSPNPALPLKAGKPCARHPQRRLITRITWRSII